MGACFGSFWGTFSSFLCVARPICDHGSNRSNFVKLEEAWYDWHTNHFGEREPPKEGEGGLKYKIKGRGAHLLPSLENFYLNR